MDPLLPPTSLVNCLPPAAETRYEGCTLIPFTNAYIFGPQRNIICIPVPGQNWVKGSYDGINADITLLKQIGGTLTVNGRQCAQLACKDSSAVTLCNDVSCPIIPEKFKIREPKLGHGLNAAGSALRNYHSMQNNHMATAHAVSSHVAPS